ncbi:MAG TPA: transposase [Pseudomonas sp.]
MPGKAHSHSLRSGRYSVPGQSYLVTTRLINGERIFADWRLGRLVVHELRLAHEHDIVHSLAWVVMPDHLHWLFELRTGTLASVMQQVKSGSGIALNKATGHSGRVWQTGYHDIAIRHEKQLKDFARYVVANPLRAGLVSRVGDYPLWDCKWL